MQLPLAVITNDQGRLTTYRYLEYEINGKELSYKVLERPADDLFALGRFPAYYAPERCFAYACVIPGAKCATKLNSKGEPLNKQFVQLIFDENLIKNPRKILPEEEVYAVDYNRKVFKAQARVLVQLCHRVKIRAGNWTHDNIMGSIYPVSYASDVVYPIWDKRDNIYSESLLTQEVLNGNTGERTIVEEFNIDHIDKTASVILIPKGVHGVYLYTGDKTILPVKSVFFPEVLGETVIHFPYNDLDVLKLPKNTFDMFYMAAHSVKNLSLPEWVAGQPNKTTTFNCSLGYYELPTLQLPDFYIKGNTTIDLNSSPSLKSLTIRKAVFGGRIEPIEIDLGDAPEFRDLTILPLCVKSGIPKIEYLAMNIASPEFRVHITTQVKDIALHIPRDLVEGKITLIFSHPVDYRIGLQIGVLLNGAYVMQGREIAGVDDSTWEYKVGGHTIQAYCLKH